MEYDEIITKRYLKNGLIAAGFSLSSLIGAATIVYSQHTIYMNIINNNPAVKRAVNLETETRELLTDHSIQSALEAYIQNQRFAERYNTLRNDYNQIIQQPGVKEELQKRNPTTFELGLFFSFLATTVLAGASSLTNLCSYVICRIRSKKKQ